MYGSSTGLRRFLTDESGMETSEYAVMVALIIAAIALALSLLSTSMESRFDSTGQIING